MNCLRDGGGNLLLHSRYSIVCSNDLIQEPVTGIWTVFLNGSQVAGFTRLTPGYASLFWPWIQVASNKQACHKYPFMMPQFQTFLLASVHLVSRSLTHPLFKHLFCLSKCPFRSFFFIRAHIFGLETCRLTVNGWSKLRF